ncbi:MAG: hypothetical protein AAF993_06370 [Pseudomonadota bacterium]
MSDAIVICHYRVKHGNEEKFEGLLKRHWPTLHQLGLVTDTPTQIYQGVEQDNGKPIYFEIFTWREGAVERAHEHPEVMAVWEPMDQLCESRQGKPNMEFPHVHEWRAA